MESPTSIHEWSRSSKVVVIAFQSSHAPRSTRPAAAQNLPISAATVRNPTRDEVPGDSNFRRSRTRSMEDGAADHFFIFFQCAEVPY